MDSLQENNTINTQSDNLELDEELMKDFTVETASYTRHKGLEERTLELKYVNNSVDLINEKLKKLKYDPDLDIVKNEYEGGFEVWECTHDLIEFLFNKGDELDLDGKSILDLGCGHGLVGIFSLKAYPKSFVYFQDYNLDVLKFATLPNIVKNNLSDDIQRCGFISGDWSETMEKVHKGYNEIETKAHVDIPKIERFNAIFMAEVIYDPENYGKLANLIQNLLAKDGICLISSKLYYFGNGGSVDEFKDFIEENYPNLGVETVHEVDDGVSNKREIMAIGFKPQN